MPHILDTRDEILKLDPSRGLLSLEQIGSQVKQAWEETRSIVFPPEVRAVKNIVVAGMGGSAYGTHVIQTLFSDKLNIPIFSSPDYTLPAWVNSQTLVVLSSYSGNTEETLSAGEDAKRKGAQICGLTTGGKLAAFLKKGKFPAYIYTPEYNPCNAPRYALGYSVFGQMAILERAGVLALTEAMYKETLEAIASVQLGMSVFKTGDQNRAKLLAFQMVDRVPVLVVAEHLEGAGHVVANALNETAKVYSEYRVIPEINHHLMEGLLFPKTNERDLLFVMIQSDLYSKSNRKRMELTSQVISKNHCEHMDLSLVSKTKLGQVFELMMYGVYSVYYLAILNHQDPVAIPWVDWFKKELAK